GELRLNVRNAESSVTGSGITWVTRSALGFAGRFRDLSCFLIAVLRSASKVESALLPSEWATSNTLGYTPGAPCCELHANIHIKEGKIHTCGCASRTYDISSMFQQQRHS